MQRQKGFALMAYAALAAVLVILALGVALKVQSSRLDSVKKEYAGFVATTKALGEVQIAKNAQTEKESKRINDDKVKSLENRLALTRAAADKLRGRPSAGGSAVPHVPAATVLVDDTARDDQLLGLLQSAQEQTDQLIELQAWVAEQAKLKP